MIDDDERVCGSHAYSENGLDWVLTGTAWGNTVEFTPPAIRRRTAGAVASSGAAFSDVGSDSSDSARSRPAVEDEGDDREEKEHEKETEEKKEVADEEAAGGGGGGGAGLERYEFSRRERPHLLFTDPRNPHRITGLTTGVMYGPSAPITPPAGGEDACYTLLQPVGP